MPDFKPFGYEGKPGTCLWCGAKLYRREVVDRALEQRLIEAGETWNEAYNHALTKAAKLGPYQDDAFCCLRCGYMFGARWAELGRRLKS